MRSVEPEFDLGVFGVVPRVEGVPPEGAEFEGGDSLLLHHHPPEVDLVLGLLVLPRRGLGPLLQVYRCDPARLQPTSHLIYMLRTNSGTSPYTCVSLLGLLLRLPWVRAVPLRGMGAGRGRRGLTILGSEWETRWERRRRDLMTGWWWLT